MTMMDLQTQLALYRTRLAERRTAMSELQFGIVLVTLPVTVHAGLLLFGQQHARAARLHVLLPFWALLVTLLLSGIVMTVYAARALWRTQRACIALRANVDQVGCRIGVSDSSTDRSADTLASDAGRGRCSAGVIRRVTV
jgi:uncharacterized membrane protein YidH (DUF202 family)